MSHIPIAARRVTDQSSIKRVAGGLLIAACLFSLSVAAQTGGIIVDFNDVHQRIDGFGAADPWVPVLSDAQADLFSSQSAGIGLSMLRIGINTNGDDMSAYSNATKAAARGAIVWAYPFSAPGAWKDNGTSNNGGHLLPQYYDAWATTLAGSSRTGELDLWLSLLDGPDVPIGARPLDPAIDTVAAGARHLSIPVPADVTARLLTVVPEAFHAGVDDVLLTGLVAAVQERLRDRAGVLADAGVLVDIESHGRVPLTEGMDLTRTVGWFTSAHPVRLTTGTTAYGQIRSGGVAAGTAVKTVKERLRAVPGDGLGYGILRHLDPSAAERLRDLPAARISFNYLGRFDATTAENGGAGTGNGEAGTENGEAGTDWQPVADAVLGGRPDDAMAMTYALEAGGLVRDLPGGPELSLSLGCPVGLFDEDALSDLITAWAAMLRGIAGRAERPDGGGHTPSDFPLVQLGQHQIDELQNLFALDDD